MNRACSSVVERHTYNMQVPGSIPGRRTHNLIFARLAQSVDLPAGRASRLFPICPRAGTSTAANCNPAYSGRLAQLVERPPYTPYVIRSSPMPPTVCGTPSRPGIRFIPLQVRSSQARSKTLSGKLVTGWKSGKSQPGRK